MPGVLRLRNPVPAEDWKTVNDTKKKTKQVSVIKCKKLEPDIQVLTCRDSRFNSYCCQICRGIEKITFKFRVR